MKLELRHLAPYLPYKLKVMMLSSVDSKEGNFEILSGIQTNGLTLLGDGGRFGFYEREFFAIKPILKPLSELHKDELHNQGFSSHRDYLTTEREADPIQFYIEGAPYEMIVYLFSKHYDVFGLIDKGLAIDINTI
jgi:hypothetical protein